MSALQLQVDHITGYRYEGAVVASYNEARMTPITMPGQMVVSSRLDVKPASWSHRYRDYWGATVTAFEVLEPHDQLRVSASSVVHVDRPPPVSRKLTWEAVTDPALADRLCEYLTLPDRVAPGDGLAARSAELRASAERPTSLAHEICALVHDEVTYVPGATEVHGTADEAWEAKEGVCQDLAHLVIGALRSQRIPARYVSGYLHPATDPVVGETVVGESHAWVEWWDGAWVPFDPTNMQVPDNRYVVVAAGRDYGDVAPLTGIFSGGDHSELVVEVSITRLQ